MVRHVKKMDESIFNEKKETINKTSGGEDFQFCVVSELTRKSIYENARFAANQDEFNERHRGYMSSTG